MGELRLLFKRIPYISYLQRTRFRNIQLAAMYDTQKIKSNWNSNFVLQSCVKIVFGPSKTRKRNFIATENPSLAKIRQLIEKEWLSRKQRPDMEVRLDALFSRTLYRPGKES